LHASNSPVRSFANAARCTFGALESDDEPQVLVSDIRMPGGSGLDLLAKVKERLPGLPVIVMTAFSDLDSAVSAFQGGAFEYLPKPFDVPKAVELIRRAVEESLREAVAADAAQAPRHPRFSARRLPCRTCSVPSGRLSARARSRCWSPARAAAARNWSRSALHKPQSARRPGRQRSIRCHQHRGDSEGPAGK
jgi:DNA-binding NarL/FixJ family response regulator